MAIQQPQPWGRGADQRLRAEFDLTVADVHDRILRRSQASAREYANNLYPPGSPGQVRYLHHVRSLSEVLLPKPGWVRDDTNNIPKLVHAGRGRLLVVTSGDSLTGVPWSVQRKHPCSKYPKGSATHSAVLRNGQLALDLGPEVADTAPSSSLDLSAVETWFLMVYVDQHQIRCEVSCPSGIDTRGRVADWSDRILLPSLPNDGTAIDIEIDDNPDEPESAIDIEIDPL